MYDSFGNYIKKSFKSILDSPILLVPTLFEFVVNLIPILIAFMGFRTFNLSMPMGFHPALIAGMVLGVLAILLILLLIEAGRYNMVKEKITNATTSMDDFWYGIKKYTGRMFLGNFILIGGTLLLLGITLVPTIMFTSMSLGRNLGILIGFSLFLFIPLIILFVFLSFWQIILVYEDCGVMKSFKMSMSFVKSQFWLILIASILRGVLTGNNNNNNRDNNNSINFGDNFHMNMPFMPGSFGILGIFGFIISIIRAILNLFFDILFFKIYDDRRNDLFPESGYRLDELDDDLKYE